ncbi:MULTISPECIES: HlyD family secretion protein [Rhodopseudomonas]|uniref:Hemolysin D n=1 Tax=Rhodopseudomonas palustris TaxID=1076 RepID=A0A0D7EVS0_RHOPL|nr:MULTISPECIES: HlyD family secretion protein [Rhodopseudomonas]KIZ44949.1 hemolysin D [Rhodopseudomonas palustris]MDF3812241.1 HlyD family secretion protein [Rhodopseudomonas sp. BAL398]WOK15415.1 HlyD family secretion protein [Rhodopseudomonas sp. BAL398]
MSTISIPEPSVVSARLTRKLLLRAALALILLGIVGAVIDVGYGYFTVGRYLETTDDAYVKADSTIVAPKVSGYITEVDVADNQPVKAGQTLARIDDRDFRAALEQSRADVASAEAAVQNIDAQLAAQQPIIDQQAAEVTASAANLAFARQEHARYDTLMRSGSGTLQHAQQTDAALRVGEAQLAQGKAALLAARRKLDVLGTQRSQAVAGLARARAVERQAELNLSYTAIVAPVDGTVGARTLRNGQYVQAGTPLMAVVPLDAVYVVGNFKETQLTNVRTGQPVELVVDTFPGIKLRGHVDSLSPASGLEFALLPPDNATGNFTKVVQRVPVKIVLDDRSMVGLLRPGMSAEPSIDTKATVLAERGGAQTTTAQARRASVKSAN